MSKETYRRIVLNKMHGKFGYIVIKHSFRAYFNYELQIYFKDFKKDKDKFKPQVLKDIFKEFEDLDFEVIECTDNSREINMLRITNFKDIVYVTFSIERIIELLYNHVYNTLISKIKYFFIRKEEIFKWIDVQVRGFEIINNNYIRGQYERNL